MLDLSSGDSTARKEGISDDKKSGMNRMDIRLYRKKLSPLEKSELEKGMRSTLQKRVSEKRTERLAQIGEIRSRTDARKAAHSSSIGKKQQEVQVKLEQLHNKGKRPKTHPGRHRSHQPL